MGSIFAFNAAKSRGGFLPARTKDARACSPLARASQRARPRGIRSARRESGAAAHVREGKARAAGRQWAAASRWMSRQPSDARPSLPCHLRHARARRMSLAATAGRSWEVASGRLAASARIAHGTAGDPLIPQRAVDISQLFAPSASAGGVSAGVQCPMGTPGAASGRAYAPDARPASAHAAR